MSDHGFESVVIKQIYQSEKHYYHFIQGSQIKPVKLDTWVLSCFLAHMMLAYIILYDFSFTNMQLSYVCKHTWGYVYFWIKFPCPVWNTSYRSSLDAGTWVWKHVSPATIFTYNLNAMFSHRHSQRHPLGHIHYSNLGNWCTRSCVWQAGRQARSLHCHTAGWGNALGCQGPSGNYSTRKLTAGRAPVERMTW